MSDRNDNRRGSAEGEKKEKYRKNVLTPKRARELALAEEEAANAPEGAEAQTDGQEAEAAEHRDYHIRRERNEKHEHREQKEEKQEYRKNVLTPKRARELALEEENKALLEAEAEQSAEEAAAEEEAEAFRDVKGRGTYDDLFKSDNDEEAQKIAYNYETAEKRSKNVRNRALIRMIISIAVLTVAASFIQLITFRVPFTPKLFNIEFSAIPELMASIAYGPLIGILICFIKNVIHILIVPSSAISAFTNFLLDSVFLFIAAYFYARSMHIKNLKLRAEGIRRKRYSGAKVIFFSFFGALVSLIPQFFITRYIAFPLLERFYGNYGARMTDLLADYQNSMTGIKNFLPNGIGARLPDVNTISQGIALINLPATIFKLIIVILVSALLLKIFLPFLHYKNKNANK